MAPRQSAGNRLIQFTLRGRDELTPVAASASKAVNNLWKNTSLLQKSFFGLAGSSILFQKQLAGATQFIANLNRQFTQAVQLAGEFGISYETALNSLARSGSQNLTSLLSSLGEVGSSTLTGLIPQTRLIQQAFSQIPIGVQQKIGQAVDAIDQLLVTVQKKVVRFVGRSQQILDGLSVPLKFLSGVREGIAIFDIFRNSIGGFINGIFTLTQEIGFFSIGLQGLSSLVDQGPFAALIGQNIRLREQLLATRASLAATNKIIQDGAVITDPTQAIQALEGTVDASIQRLKQRSLELVGVTFQELIPVFQRVAQNAGDINASMNDITDLTVGFAAAMGTANLPLAFANEEVQSILTGTTSTDTQLRNILGVNNELLQQWKSQGTLVQNLNERFKTFVEGNKIAAQQFNGVTSNIADVFEDISQRAGEPILDTLLAELNPFFENLQKNSGEVERFIEGLVMNANRALKAFIDLGKEIAKAIAPLARTSVEFLFESLAKGAEAANRAVTDTIKILQPFITLLGELLKIMNPVGNVVFETFIRLKSLQVGIGGLTKAFGIASNAVVGLGDALFFLNVRANPLLQIFTGLSKTVGAGNASFLGLLAAFNKLNPAIQGLVTSKFGILGPLFTRFAQPVGSLGVALAAASKQFPAFNEVLKLANKQLIQGANNLVPLLQAQGLPKLAEQVEKVAKSGNVLDFANQKAIASTEGLGKAVRGQVIKFAAVAAGVGLAVFAINELVLKNEEVLETVKSLIGFIIGLPQQIAQFVVSPLGAATAAVIALTVALNTNLQAAIANMVVTALPGLAAAATKVSQAFLALSKSQAIVAAFPFIQAGAIKAAAAFKLLSASVAAGTVTFGKFFVAVKAGFAALAAAAAPLLVIISGLALIGIIRRTKDLADANEANAITQAQVNRVNDQGISIAERLKRAKEAQTAQDEKGVALTAKQIQENQKLRKEARLQIANIEDQIAILKKANKDASKEVKEFNESQIQQLETVKTALVSQSSSIRIANKELTELGDTAEQLAKEIENASKVLESPRDLQALTDAAAKITDITQAQIELGEVDLSTARSRFNELANLTTLPFTEQRKARQALQQVIQQDSQLRNQELQAEIKTFEAKKGFINSAQKAEIEITMLKREQLEDRLNATFDQLNEEDNLNSTRARQLLAQEKELKADLIQLDKETLDLRFRLAQQALDREITQIDFNVAFGGFDEAQAENEKFVKEENKLLLELQKLAERRQIIDPTDEKALDEIVDAENKVNLQRIQALDKFLSARAGLLGRDRQNLLTELEQLEVDAEIDRQKRLNASPREQRKIELERLQARKKRLGLELRTEQDFLAALEALPIPRDPKLAQKREEQIGRSRLKSSQLILDIAKTEGEEQQKLTEIYKRELEKRNELIDNSVQVTQNELAQVDRLAEQVQAGFERQSRLINARGQLQSSITGFVDVQFDILQKTARTEKERAEFAKQAAEAQRALLEDNIKIERERLRISQETRRSELQIQIIRAKVAQLQAQANTARAESELAGALEDPTVSDRRIRALELQVEANEGVEQGQGELVRRLESRFDDLDILDKLEQRSQNFQFDTRRDQADLRVAESQTSERERQSALRGLSFGRTGSINDALRESRRQAAEVQGLGRKETTKFTNQGASQASVELAIRDVQQSIKDSITFMNTNTVNLQQTLEQIDTRVRTAIRNVSVDPQFADEGNAAPVFAV